MSLAWWLGFHMNPTRESQWQRNLRNFRERLAFTALPEKPLKNLRQDTIDMEKFRVLVQSSATLNAHPEAMIVNYHPVAPRQGVHGLWWPFEFELIESYRSMLAPVLPWYLLGERAVACLLAEGLIGNPPRPRHKSKLARDSWESSSYGPNHDGPFWDRNASIHVDPPANFLPVRETSASVPLPHAQLVDQVANKIVNCADANVDGIEETK